MHHRDEKRHPFTDLFEIIPKQKFEEESPSPFHHETKNRVAVKCDLCAGYDYYACVHACPVGAAMRIDPVEAFGRRDLLIGLEMQKTKNR
jgi:Fe-S-cluster-containing hydrogenase component 2